MAIRKTAAPPTPADFERIAESIRTISNTAKQMRTAGLTRRAIVTLLHDATGVTRKDIATVLDATESLASWCLSK